MQCLWSERHDSTLGYTVRMLPGFPSERLCPDTLKSSFDALVLGTGESWRHNKGLSGVFSSLGGSVCSSTIQQLRGSGEIMKPLEPLSSRVWGSSTYQAAGED